MGTSFAAHDQPEKNSLDALAIGLLIAGPAALTLRRRHPVAVLIFTFAVTLAYNVLDYPDGPVFFALIAAYVAAVVFGHKTLAVTMLVVGYFAFLWLGYLFGTKDPPTLGEALAVAAWHIGIFAFTEMALTRRERAIEARRTRREESMRRASEERLRIAQELHDVLAHNISLINVQAGVALHLMDDQPEHARTALSAIKGASDDALGELRSVLDILRQGTEEAPRYPTPGLADVDELVERTRSAGMDASLEVEGHRTRVPPAVDRAAFRIVQEALTNTVRHAGPARTSVRIAYRPHELLITIEDNGRGGTARPSQSGGNGIPGMRGRAAALGGELEAGPKAAGGFLVRARLPLRNGRGHET